MLLFGGTWEGKKGFTWYVWALSKCTCCSSSLTKLIAPPMIEAWSPCSNQKKIFMTFSLFFQLFFFTHQIINCFFFFLFSFFLFLSIIWLQFKNHGLLRVVLVGIIFSPLIFFWAIIEGWLWEKRGLKTEKRENFSFFFFLLLFSRFFCSSILRVVMRKRKFSQERERAFSFFINYGKIRDKVKKRRKEE